MDFVPLTKTQRQEFDANGYLVVPGALDAKTVQRLTEAGDRLMSTFEYEGFYAHRRPGLVQEEDIFASLVTNTSTISLVAQLLGPNIHLTNTALIYKYPQPSNALTSRNWHRDLGVQLDIGHKHLPRLGLKVGYCLTDFTEPNSGATLFVRKSHSWPEPLAIPKGKVDPPVFDEPRLHAGDAFLFENRIYHAPALNFTDTVAKVAIYGYHYCWVKPDYYLQYYNDKLQPDEPLLAKLDNVGRQLLGAQEDTKGRIAPNGIHWALEEWAAHHNITLQRYPQVVES